MALYTIELTDSEITTLGWAADRGYFPTETYDNLSLAEGQPEDVDKNTLRTWELEEHAAWAISEHDPHSLFACIGDDLLRKLLELEQAIV